MTKQKGVLIGVGAVVAYCSACTSTEPRLHLYPVGLISTNALATDLARHSAATNWTTARKQSESKKRQNTRKSRWKKLKRKSHEEQARRERSEAGEADARAVERRSEREQQLTAKLGQERAVEEREPEGSFAYDLAKGEYEATRAEAQQLLIEAKSEEGK